MRQVTRRRKKRNRCHAKGYTGVTKTVRYTHFASVVWFMQISIFLSSICTFDTIQKYLLWKNVDFRQLLLLYKRNSLHPYTVYGITKDKCDVSKHSNMSEIKLDQIYLEQTKMINFVAFWYIMHSSLVHGYQHSRWPYCLNSSGAK